MLLRNVPEVSPRYSDRSNNDDASIEYSNELRCTAEKKSRYRLQRKRLDVSALLATGAGMNTSQFLASLQETL